MTLQWVRDIKNQFPALFVRQDDAAWKALAHSTVYDWRAVLRSPEHRRFAGRAIVHALVDSKPTIQSVSVAPRKRLASDIVQAPAEMFDLLLAIATLRMQALAKVYNEPALYEQMFYNYILLGLMERFPDKQQTILPHYNLQLSGLEPLWDLLASPHIAPAIKVHADKTIQNRFAVRPPTSDEWQSLAFRYPTIVSRAAMQAQGLPYARDLWLSQLTLAVYLSGHTAVYWQARAVKAMLGHLSKPDQHKLLVTVLANHAMAVDTLADKIVAKLMQSDFAKVPEIDSGLEALITAYKPR